MILRSLILFVIFLTWCSLSDTNNYYVVPWKTDFLIKEQYFQSLLECNQYVSVKNDKKCGNMRWFYYHEPISYDCNLYTWNILNISCWELFDESLLEKMNIFEVSFYDITPNTPLKTERKKSDYVYSPLWWRLDMTGQVFVSLTSEYPREILFSDGMQLNENRILLRMNYQEQ